MFDSIILKIGHTSRKSRDFTFVFFTSKWSKIKDPIEIKKRQLKKLKIFLVSATGTGNTQFLNNNCLKVSKVSFLS